MGRAEAWKGRWGLFLDGYFTYVGASGSKVGSKEISFGPADFSINKQINLGGLTISVPVRGQVGPGNITLIPSGSAKAINRIGNLDLGVRYLLGALPLNAEKPLPVLTVELLGGPRFNSINQYMRVNLSGIKIANVPVNLGKFQLMGSHESVKNGALVVDYTNQYFEPFLGMRFSLWFTPKFLASFTGDVGGFGMIADDHVDCNLELVFGYRPTSHIYVWAGYRALGTWYDMDSSLARINFAAWAHGPVLGMTYAF